MNRPQNLEFDFAPAPARQPSRASSKPSFAKQVLDFQEFGTATTTLETEVHLAGGGTAKVPTFVNEFWTSRQRQANSLHEISYRACFKPQLPRFFVERLTEPGEVVLDPFMGRGTTPLESALLGRVPYGCDINPVSLQLTRPRLRPADPKEVEQRLNDIDLEANEEFPEDLLVFYHPETLREICALKAYLLRRQKEGRLDALDDWIGMVSLNRLTGHSVGFLSVYTLPPNQAVSVKAQLKINKDRNQTPPRRSLRKIVNKKSRQLVSDCDPKTIRGLAEIAVKSKLIQGPADRAPALPSNSAALVVTSPPFLDVVDYATDNWLRCWFLGMDARSVALTTPKTLEVWEEAMTRVFVELHRILRPGGHVAFEVGEVRAGSVRLEESVIRCALAAQFEPLLIMINDQAFTKTANCWGVSNNNKGTNTNRIALLRKTTG